MQLGRAPHLLPKLLNLISSRRQIGRETPFSFDLSNDDDFNCETPGLVGENSSRLRVLPGATQGESGYFSGHDDADNDADAVDDNSGNDHDGYDGKMVWS